jgi:enoyl-[acyl-carrier protein] reductase I
MINLNGSKGLIVGIANENSIAYGCAQALSKCGAKLAITYGREKTKQFVEPLLKQTPADIFMPLDVTNDAQVEALFDAIGKKWGKLDFLIHSIAFAPKEDLQSRLVDASKDGFLLATEISCYSLIKLTKHAELLMQQGGSILTMTYYGSQKVIQDYALMGPIKAALESVVRYLAAELGKEKIRVNAISPGPIATRAASGLKNFNKLLEMSANKRPITGALTPIDIGYMAAFLVSNLSQNITGTIHYVDGGYSSLG